MLRKIATALCALSIISYQLGLLPFFAPLITSNRDNWWITLGTFLAINLLTAAVALVRYPITRVHSLPLLAYCVIAGLISLAHGTGHIERSFLISLTLFLCTAILSLASDPKQLLRFSASVTLLSATITLGDVLFDDGFTNSIGRAAGFGINPNITATTLLVGAGATFWVIPARFAPIFLTVVGGAIIVTLSKSTLLAGIMVLVGIIGLRFLIDLHQHRDISYVRKLAKMLPIQCGLIALYVILALAVNDRFRVAFASSYQTFRFAASAFDTAQEYITKQAAMNAHRAKNKQLLEIEEISERVQNEGQVNSISARALLFKRAWLTYKSGPSDGIGLNAAHRLVPHNTFLLFAVAFGHLGWLIPLILICLSAYGARNLPQLSLSLCLTAALMFSHDIMLTPVALIPVALGLAGQIAQREAPIREIPHQPRWGPAFALLLFVVGTLTCSIEAHRNRLPIDENLIFPSHGNAYATTFKRPLYSGVLRVSSIDLLENGKPLGPENATEDDVITLGRGRNFHVSRTIVFSTSDNTDPRKNGRTYEIATTSKLHPLSVVILLILVGWTVVFWARPKLD